MSNLGIKYYIFMDEYGSFANNILIHSGEEKYRYYLGLMTIKEAIHANKFVLQIPNEVVKTLDREYIRCLVEEFFKLKINISFLFDEFDKMAFQGEWKSALCYVLDKLYETASLRDFIDRDSGVKMFLLAYLGMDPLYMIES